MIIQQQQNLKQVKEVEPGDTFVYHGSYYIATNYTKHGSTEIKVVNLETGEASIFAPDVEVYEVTIIGVVR